MTTRTDVALPSGTVTFLFSDIESSTVGVATLGDETWAEMLAVHHLLIRNAVAAHHGHEVGTDGDAFFVAFARASDALAAALEAQQGLEGHTWGETRLRVRIGLHTGEALVSEGDYVGHEVHRAKRICDAGHGGQILCSDATVVLVRSSLSAGASLTDLGLHRLKDLGEAQRLWQVSASGLQSEFPAPRSLDCFTHNLPAQRTSFVGRQAEIAGVRKLLEDHRLVTLTGIGGAGKTRLALQVGAELLDAYPEGVFFVDLASLSDDTAIASAVAGALDLSLGAGIGAAPVGRTEDVVVGYLARRRCLLVFDNCEHLLDAAGAMIDRILDACPEVSVLATSREALDLDGEQSWRVPSLSVADPAGSEAVALFVARAQSVEAGFGLTEDNAVVVADICRRLDGIPLAIEFAASRVSHLQPKEIASRLDDMFRLLTGGRRRVQRQQTLQAALDWSHDLLSESERVLLRRLAVFMGDFSMAAAEGICTDDHLRPSGVLDLLGSLVSKSLLTTVPERDGTRYRLMETVRLYASEKLRQAEDADPFRARHRDWYQAWVESSPWEDALSSPHPALARWSRDLPNLRAALEWSEAAGRPELVMGIAARLLYLWASEGVEEGQRWLSVARPEDLDMDPEARVAALAAASFMATSLADPVAGRDLAERAVNAGGDVSSLPLHQALIQRARSRAIAAAATNDAELAAVARADLDRVEQMASAWSKSLRGHTAANRATVELILFDAGRAQEAAEAAARDADSVIAHGLLATAAHITGQRTKALSAARRFLELVADRAEFGAAFATFPGPVAALADGGEAERAAECLGESLEAWGARPGALERFAVSAAVLAYLGGDAECCSRLLGWVRSVTFDVGRIITSPSAYALYRHYVPVVRQSLDPGDARRCLDEGRALSDEDVTAFVVQACRR